MKNTIYLKLTHTLTNRVLLTPEYTVGVSGLMEGISLTNYFCEWQSEETHNGPTTTWSTDKERLIRRHKCMNIQTESHLPGTSTLRFSHAIRNFKDSSALTAEHSSVVCCGLEGEYSFIKTKHYARHHHSVGLHYTRK